MAQRSTILEARSLDFPRDGNALVLPVERNPYSRASLDGTNQRAAVDAMDQVPTASEVRPLPPPPASAGRDGDMEPTKELLRTSIRLLLHIARQGRFGPGETPPESLTRAGMAAALGTSQGAVSNSLGRLVDGGVLAVETDHVRHRLMRVKVYRLTPRGEELVRRLRMRFPGRCDATDPPRPSRAPGARSVAAGTR
jgi:DNA-binding MarR family transcriptional regulator